MTEFDIQNTLFGIFKKLNEFSGIQYLKTDDDGNLTNVHFPNAPFSVPDSKRYFDLTFRSNEPEQSVILDGSQIRLYGVLYIDIVTPLDSGEDEAESKYRWIARLFNANEYTDDVAIMKVYISTKDSHDDSYRLQCAVEWEADIDRE